MEIGEINEEHIIEVEQLTVDMVIKSYKEMCKLLGEKERKLGNSRNAQFKEWARYFKWHKEGHRFVIDEIYSIPKDKVDGRGKSANSHKTIYGKYIEKLILDLLSQNIENGIKTINVSKSSLLEALAMVNKNYIKGLQNKENVAQRLEMDTEYIKDFYNHSYSNLKQTLESALNRLDNKSLITWKKSITIINNNTDITIADDDMENLITAVEVQVMQEINCENRKAIVLKDKWGVFMTKVCHKLREYDIKLDYYYRSYKINFNEFVTKELQKVTEFLLENDDRTHTQTELNEVIVEKYKENNQKRYEKYLEQFHLAFGEKSLRHYEEIKVSKNYVPYSNKLVDELISIDKKF